jgi:acyl carrier protein
MRPIYDGLVYLSYPRGERLIMDVFFEGPGTLNEEIWDTLTKSISDVTSIDRALITYTASLRDELAVNSMDMVDVLATVEERLGVTLDDLEFTKIITAGDAHKMFADKVKLHFPLTSEGTGNAASIG